MQAREIGAFTFPSRKAAECEIRSILHNSPLNQPLVGAHSELITALVGLHHEAEEKIGAGIDHIEIRCIEYGARGFWIVRTDGTAVDFSYRTALGGARPHPEQVRRAMRFAIRDQIDDFRRVAFREAGDYIQCPLTGQDVTLGPWAHVDHVVDFATLADDYASIFDGYQNIPVASSMSHPGPALEDPHLSLWRRYHASRAELRVVHASANLARARKGAA